MTTRSRRTWLKSRSTIYVAILGRTYGRLLRSRLSATHAEYREAERLGLRISAWVRTGDDRQGDQQAFLDEIRTFHTTGSFSDPTDLAANVADRLRRIAAEEVSPWCKIGDAVFRAQRIIDDGKEITVEASVHDAQVLAYLEARRPGWWNGGPSWLTYASRSLPVEVKEVTTTTTAARATSVRLLLVPDRGREPSRWTVSASLTAFGRTYSSDDVTEMNLRKALFGERVPRDVLTFGGKVPDPFADFPTEPLAEGTLRSLVRLLLVEALIGSQRASRVTNVKLSAPTDGQRSLVVSWECPGRDGRPGEQRTVDGVIALPR